ncbi:hypothetical protein A2Y85_04505 [candidate division WOR-3 bacterium RBG_13_43_14]|uniref:Glutamine amidotransferase domain-containing protein n=1 Tax=candidate division WOR-3 bacterium RBG_13_43_14 TaxID=1802590 RepID=A0A1F4U2K8_UNCW3|nr:MAG: hypothetical protein A2Y85_04505 [candidate division WOR-3 bacterium RBG_13_43_14]
MRTLIIDNYLQNSPEIEELYKVISEATVHTVEVHDYTSLAGADELKCYDAIVLSGSQSLLSDAGTLDYYNKEMEILRAIEKPTLGICFGHQLLAAAFGEQIRRMPHKLDGYYSVHRLTDDELFANVPEHFLVKQSHLEFVEDVPYNFIKTAESPNCVIEAMKHERLPIYGIQFHAERFNDKHPFGQVIIENFFKLATWFMK